MGTPIMRYRCRISSMHELLNFHEHAECYSVLMRYRSVLACDTALRGGSHSSSVTLSKRRYSLCEHLPSELTIERVFKQYNCLPNSSPLPLQPSRQDRVACLRSHVGHGTTLQDVSSSPHYLSFTTPCLTPQSARSPPPPPGPAFFPAVVF